MDDMLAKEALEDKKAKILGGEEDASKSETEGCVDIFARTY